jgi:hypothetical protein
MPNGMRCGTTILSPEYSSCLTEMSETHPQFSPGDCELRAACGDGFRLDVLTQASPASPPQVSPDRVAPAQNQRATEGAWSLARRRWQEGTVYLRKSKNLLDAWWGRFVETVETERGPVRVQRNVRLGEARLYTKPQRRGHCGNTWTGLTTINR